VYTVQCTILNNTAKILSMDISVCCQCTQTPSRLTELKGLIFPVWSLLGLSTTTWWKINLSRQQLTEIVFFNKKPPDRIRCTAEFPTRNYLNVGIIQYSLLQESPSENAVKSPIRKQTTSRNKNTVVFPNFTPQRRLKEISKMCSLLQETTYLNISSLTRNHLSEEARSHL
jgi:hypothetical protein